MSKQTGWIAVAAGIAVAAVSLLLGTSRLGSVGGLVLAAGAVGALAGLAIVLRAEWVAAAARAEPQPGFRRVAAALTSLCFSLGAVLVAVVILFVRGEGLSTQTALNIPSVRRSVVEELLRHTRGVMDSHPDPDVGRVLVPNLERRSFERTPVTSNRFGMRDRDYAVPKEPGVVRVVLLGDSYVFGNGVEADVRTGVFLEEFLRERAGNDALEVECLHVGIASWNVLNECAFLRRTLDSLQPDLVVHVLRPNDLDDNFGVRGFGAMATFDPYHRGRADSRVTLAHALSFLPDTQFNHLLQGLDHESRQRYEDARDHVLELTETLDRAGVRYLMLACWGRNNPLLWKHVGSHLDADQVAFLPQEFNSDRRYWVSPGDGHWNADGHERVARLLYGLIVERELLPELQLAAWPAAREEVAVLHEPARQSALGERAPVPHSISSEIDLRAGDASVYRQVYAGVDGEGLVSPYASLMLRARDGGSLRLEGRCLAAPQLEDTRVRVFVEETELGEFALAPGEAIDRTWRLPDSVRGRAYVNVRFVSSDWVLTGDELRHCVVFEMQRVSISR